MSNKSYWIINQNRNVYGSAFVEYYFNCPKCKSTTMFVMPEELPMPDPKYCQHCGKRLYIKEK